MLSCIYVLRMDVYVMYVPYVCVGTYTWMHESRLCFFNLCLCLSWLSTHAAVYTGYLLFVRFIPDFYWGR